MGPTQIIGILLGKAGFTTGIDFSAQQQAVLWNIRLPRVLLGLVAGTALAVSGVALQAVFRNPMADPALLGISSGATTGVVLALVTGVSALGSWTQPAAAFLGALTASLWLHHFSKRQGRTDLVTLILSGVALQILLAAVVTLLISIARKPGLRDASFWTLGSLSGTLWANVALAAPVVISATFLLWRLAPQLNLFLLGETEARHLGVDTGATRLQAIILVSLVTGTVVAFCGSIAFVGLVIPHLLRMITGPDHRLLLPASALGGAALLTFGDVFARTIISPMEMPIGVLLTVIGGPLFFYLISRSRKTGAW
jgi:iron complex transport system permease protein